MSAFLEHCDRQVTTEEVTHYLEKDHPSHEAGVARRKRSKERIDDAMTEFERVEAICARAEEDGYAPDSNALQVLTGTRRLDNQKNESWCQVDMYDRSKDELMLLVEHARVHGLLPKWTFRVRVDGFRPYMLTLTRQSEFDGGDPRDKDGNERCWLVWQIKADSDGGSKVEAPPELIGV